MSSSVIHISSLLARLWTSAARVRAETTLAIPSSHGAAYGGEPNSQCGRLTDREAVYLAIVNGPVPF